MCDSISTNTEEIEYDNVYIYLEELLSAVNSVAVLIQQPGFQMISFEIGKPIAEYSDQTGIFRLTSVNDINLQIDVDTFLWNTKVREVNDMIVDIQFKADGREMIWIADK